MRKPIAWSRRHVGRAVPEKAAAFRPGAAVAHGTCGVGRIVRTEWVTVGGEPVETLVAEFPTSKATLRVPKSKAALALRPLASEGEMARALSALGQRPSSQPREPWYRRRRAIEAKLNSGDLKALTEIVRELSGRSTDAERLLHNRAVARLADELAAVEHTSRGEAAARIMVQLGQGPAPAP